RFRPFRKLRVYWAGLRYAIKNDVSVGLQVLLSGLTVGVCLVFHQWLDVLVILGTLRTFVGIYPRSGSVVGSGQAPINARWRLMTASPVLGQVAPRVARGRVPSVGAGHEAGGPVVGPEGVDHEDESHHRPPIVIAAEVDVEGLGWGSR